MDNGDRVHALVLDPRRHGTADERAAYLSGVEARYAEVEGALDRLCAQPDWGGRSRSWIDDQLELVSTVLYQLGTLHGAYDVTRAWGERVLELGIAASPVRRAELMLHLSELHRVTGQPDRSRQLVEEAAALLGLAELSPAGIDALAPVSCHALFCLGATAYWEGRPEDAAPLLGHAWAHGGDSAPHLWSLVNYALLLSDAGDHQAALSFEDAAIEMAQRLGDQLAISGVRNNRACTLRHLGRFDEAYDEFAVLLPQVLADDTPDAVLTCTEDFACLLFDMGRDQDGALLIGAVEAERAATGVPRVDLQEAAVTRTLEAGRERLGSQWVPLLGRGVELGVLAAVASALHPAAGGFSAR